MTIYENGHCWRFEVSLFQASLGRWSYLEVVVRKVLIFEWSICESLRSVYGRLCGWPLLEVYSFIISSNLGKWSNLEV